MNILLLNQFFYPDAAPTSQLLTDLARALAADGHSVRVVCGRSVYADAEARADSPVEGIRAFNLGFQHGVIGRVSSYLMYLAGAARHSLFGPRPDVVLTLTTPPGLSVLGSLVRLTRGTRHFIWEMDVYPDIVSDVGVLKRHSLPLRALGWVLDASRCRADGVIAIGECMRDRLIGHGVPPSKIKVAENWADGRWVYPLQFPAQYPLTIFYSGNLGLAHDIETIRGAIRHFRADSRFRFCFAGSGRQRPTLESFCRKYRLSNVSFTGYRATDEFLHSLGSCHVGLITQKRLTVGSVVPSKTYCIMAAGRPILYIGPPEATPARVIERFRCGWQINPGDTGTLIALLEHLAGNPSLIREAGARGREAFLQHYDLPIGVARICSILGASRSKLETGVPGI